MRPFPWRTAAVLHLCFYGLHGLQYGTDVFEWGLGAWLHFAALSSTWFYGIFLIRRQLRRYHRESEDLFAKIREYNAWLAKMREQENNRKN